MGQDGMGQDGMGEDGMGEDGMGPGGATTVEPRPTQSGGRGERPIVPDRVA